MEASLNRESSGARIEVMNFGENHATSTTVLKSRLPLARRYAPDFYILFSGYNDYDKALRKMTVGPSESKSRSAVKPEPSEPDHSEEAAVGILEREDIIERITLFFLSYGVFAHRLREWIAKVWYKNIDYFYKRERARARGEESKPRSIWMRFSRCFGKTSDR